MHGLANQFSRRFVRVKEVLERGYADFYDAFADMDTDHDGRVALQDFQEGIKSLDGGEDLTSDQIDSAFHRCGVDVDGRIVYKDFHAAFMDKDTRTATDTGGISSSIIPRAFEEVLLSSNCSFACNFLCAIFFMRDELSAVSRPYTGLL